MPAASAQRNRANKQTLQLLRGLWTEAMQDREVYLWGKDLGTHKFEGFAFTQDEHDDLHPVKHMPDRPHLRVASQLFDQSQKLICYKSRQLMLSWFFASIILHECLRTPGRRWLVSCKKEEDANELLLRMLLQYNQIPSFLPPKLKAKYCLLTIHHPNGVNSTIEAAAENADDPRSKTYSGIWVDESSFTVNLSELLAAAGPTTMGGGKLVLTSTPNGRDYGYELLTDKGRLEF